MSLADAPPASVMRLAGTAWERGRAQAAGADPATFAQVRKATVERAATAHRGFDLTTDMYAYVAAQRRFHEVHDPHGMAELAGIAVGFGFSFDDLFLHLHVGTLRDLAGRATLVGDGCSAWASGLGPDGPLVVKNRDYSGTHLGVQRLMWHEGPDITTGGMLCLGSLGSPGAYSSGMNSAGLALADTQIGTRRHAVGWLRYMVMTRLLANCSTVDDALDWLAAVPHAGGGSLVLGDASGVTAAVELGCTRIAVTRGAVNWHTNHFFSSELAAETLLREGARIDANSEARLAFLSAALGGASEPGLASAAALMARHREDEGEAPICQHPGNEDDTSTLSSIIYAIASRQVYFHPGNPCAGQWRRFDLPC